MSEDLNTKQDANVSLPPGRLRVLGYVLAASLSVNIFLGGFVAARVLNAPEVHEEPSTVAFEFASLPFGLPPETREQMENALRQQRERMQEVYVQYAQTQEKVRELLVQDSVHVDELEEQLAALRALNADLQFPMHEAMATLAAEMDVAARRALVRALPEPRRVRVSTPTLVDGSRWAYDREGGGLRFDFQVNASQSGNTEDGESYTVVITSDDGTSEVAIGDASVVFVEGEKSDEAEEKTDEEADEDDGMVPLPRFDF